MTDNFRSHSESLECLGQKMQGIRNKFCSLTFSNHTWAHQIHTRIQKVILDDQLSLTVCSWWLLIEGAKNKTAWKRYWETPTSVTFTLLYDRVILTEVMPIFFHFQNVYCFNQMLPYWKMFLKSSCGLYQEDCYKQKK